LYGIWKPLTSANGLLILLWVLKIGCVFFQGRLNSCTPITIFFSLKKKTEIGHLAKPYAPHDTFNGIPAESVTATGLNIIPGIHEGKPALFLSIPFRGGQSKFKNVPLQMGLRVVRQQLPANKPFLPVLMKGDLRELDASTPCLHLHAIHLDRLIEHSELERKSNPKSDRAATQQTFLRT
jgi:hypothetical protein